MFVKEGDYVCLTGEGWPVRLFDTEHLVEKVNKKYGFAWISEDGDYWVVEEEGEFKGERAERVQVADEGRV